LYAANDQTILITIIVNGIQRLYMKEFEMNVYIKFAHEATYLPWPEPVLRTGEKQLRQNLINLGIDARLEECPNTTFKKVIFKSAQDRILFKLLGDIEPHDGYNYRLKGSV